MKIYRDFDHYWSEGDHPWSSASRDIAREEWDRFEPTINATRDDYKKMYVELCIRKANEKSELIDALFQYIETFTIKDSPKFFRWWSDQMKENGHG